jgi:predicted naringenin-chalcone synthase
MSTARVTGLGAAAPAARRTSDLADFFAADALDAASAHRIFAGTAIATRHLAVDPLVEDPRGWDTDRRIRRALAVALTLGAVAGAEALADAGVAAGDVGLLATVTSTTHDVPGLNSLAGQLGLPADVEPLALGPMGCYAALAGLAACRTWVERHGRPALLICADVFSPHLQPGPYDKEQVVVHALFGDGAAAVVLRPGEPGLGGFDIVDVATLSEPAYAGDVALRVADSGVRVHLTRRLPDVVAAQSVDLVASLLARHDLAQRDVTWWAVHPGGRRVIDRLTDAFALPETALSASRTVLRHHGNTISSGVLLVLRLLRGAGPRPGGYGVALAFGPGLTLWAMLLRTV